MLKNKKQDQIKHEVYDTSLCNDLIKELHDCNDLEHMARQWKELAKYLELKLNVKKEMYRKIEQAAVGYYVAHVSTNDKWAEKFGEAFQTYQRYLR